MRIVIDNLPHDVSEDEIREALSPFTAAGNITLITEGSLPSAIIEVDMSHADAVTLAMRIDGHFFKDRRLRVWVPRWQG
ncbi:MAG: RNA-binding protein [Pseudomonadota bacterium]